MNWPSLYLKNKIDASFAELRSQRLSVELRSKYKELSDNLDNLPPAPKTSLGHNTNERVANTVLMAEISRDMSLDCIRDGEELITAALEGETDIFVQINQNTMKRLLGHFNSQLTLYENHLTLEKKSSFSYYLTQSYKASTELLILFLKTAINDTDLSHDSLQTMMEEAKVLHKNGQDYIDQGRKQTSQQRMIFTVIPAKNEEIKKMKEVLIEVLSQNVPASFHIEEKLLEELMTFFSFTNEQNGITDIDVVLNDFINKVTLLENERQRLALERQNKIANLQ
ncbi:MAG: hypothetical protein HWE30_02685 [Methylocystaceae bacterium]|nr:hypothetical protein [Methylocystaceae bacterium]